MKKVFRLLALAGVSIVGLVLSGSAMAAYTTPKLTILNPSERLGGGGPLTIKVEQSKDDDATFRLVIYVPQGYVSSLVQNPGATIGSVTAQVQAKAISADAIVPVTGTVVAEDPAPYRTNPQSVGCVGSGNTIDSVYMLRLQAAGTALNVPMYVTTVTAGPESAFASGKFTVCLPSPDVPPAQGGATLGAKLINAAITLRGIFANPSTGGNYVWRTLFTPYATGTGTPNPAGTVEAQSIDRLPAQLTLTAGKYNKRTKRVVISGSITEGPSVGVSRASIRVLVGSTARRVKQVGIVRANTRGIYRASIRINSKARYAYIRTRVVVPTRTTNGCAQRTNPSIVCLRTTVSGFTLFNNRVIRVRLR